MRDVPLKINQSKLTQLNDSDKVFIRAVAPNKIEICTASKDNLPEANVDIQKLNKIISILNE